MGVEHFAEDSPILASGHDPSFIAHENLPTHSLCEFLGIPTPQYTPTLVPHLHTIQSAYPTSTAPGPPSPLSLGLTVLHTPGHTPDELAIWDENDQFLYVGDTLYEKSQIIFPNEGSIVQWFASVDTLIQLVAPFPKAQLACGHTTANKPATDVLTATKAFMKDVVGGKEVEKARFEKRGETCVYYVQNGARFSLACPIRLVEEARQAGLGA